MPPSLVVYHPKLTACLKLFGTKDFHTFYLLVKAASKFFINLNHSKKNTPFYIIIQLVMVFSKLNLLKILLNI